MAMTGDYHETMKLIALPSTSFGPRAPGAVDYSSGYSDKTVSAVLSCLHAKQERLEVATATLQHCCLDCSQE